jgi:ATP-dependent DNA helicase RecG
MKNVQDLLNQFRAMPAEVEWLEFKEAKATFEVESLGEYFSALANEANLKNQPAGWLILGVQDKKKDPTTGKRMVVGTEFKKGTAAQNELKRLIADHTPHRATFRDIHDLTVDGKRVMMLEVPPAPPGVPISWKGHFYGREGESLGALSLAELDQIRSQTDDWSAEVRDDARIADLDPAAIALARTQYKEKHSNLTADTDSWSDEVFLNKAKLTRSGRVTCTALLLLGRPEAQHFLSPADPRITWVLKNADGTDRDYHHYGPPFLMATTAAAQRIRNTNYQFLRDQTLFPTQILQYDPWVLRELLHNAIAHQDYRLNGRVTLVEKEDCLILSNPGTFIPGSVEKVIAANSPPDRYRNRMLVNAMVELNMIDTIGSGIPKAFGIQRQRGFPLPDYDFEDAQRVTVTLYGKVLDVNYTRALLAKTDLSLAEVMALDKVQKHLVLTDREFASLKQKQLIEGRRPNLYVSATIAAVSGKKADYVLTAGFDDEYYKDLILKLIDKFGQATPTDISDTLLGKLPDALKSEQKRNKVRNLIQELQRSGLIENVGKHGLGAKWTKKAPSA